MGSKLAPHWCGAHWDAKRDIPIFARWKPPAIKVMWPEGLHPYLDAIRHIPLIVVRRWDISEQKDFTDAASARRRGQEHADIAKAMREEARSRYGFTDSRQLVWEGLNEPWAVPVDLLCEYEVARLDALAGYGLPGAALSYGVGWPGNTGPGTPVNWSPLERVHFAILRGSHYLSTHEYWWHESVKGLHPDTRGGWEGGWRWEAGRYLQCPWDVPILITETGIDEGVVKDQPNHGWRHFYDNDPARYVAQLAEYDAEIRKDKRIVAAFIYTHDTNDRKWQSFDTREDNFLNAFLPYIESQAGQPEPPQVWGDAAITPWRALCEKYGEQHQIDARILGTQIKIESGGRADARGSYTPVGEVGLMQVIPSGDGTLKNPGFAGRPTVAQLLDPDTNVRTGAEILAGSIAFFGGDIRKGLMGFNAGPNWVKQHPDATDTSSNYVAKFKAAWNKLWPGTALPWTSKTTYARWACEEAAREARDGKGQQAHDRLVAWVIPFLRKLEGV